MNFISNILIMGSPGSGKTLWTRAIRGMLLEVSIEVSLRADKRQRILAARQQGRSVQGGRGPGCFGGPAWLLTATFNPGPPATVRKHTAATAAGARRVRMALGALRGAAGVVGGKLESLRTPLIA